MILLAFDMMFDRIASAQTGLSETAPRPRSAWGQQIRAWPLVTMTVALASILIAAGGLADRFQWDRSAAGGRAAWQLLSCHLTHWSGEHLLWDVLALLILGYLCEARSRAATIACLLASAVTIGLGVQLLLPEMAFYRGLSGVDSALLGLLVTMWLGDAITQRNWRAAVLPVATFLLFATKLAIELTTGSAVFVHTSQMVPVPLAHAIGLGCGMAVGVVSAVAER